MRHYQKHKKKAVGKTPDLVVLYFLLQPASAIVEAYLKTKPGNKL